MLITSTGEEVLDCRETNFNFQYSDSGVFIRSCCKHAMTWLNSNSACDESFQSGLCVEQGGPCILKMSALVPHGHMDLHSTWEFNFALARLNLAQICCRWSFSEVYALLPTVARMEFWSGFHQKISQTHEGGVGFTVSIESAWSFW